MNCLIVGGTSGLGLALAQQLRDQEHRVTVMGRHDPGERSVGFCEFDLRDNCARLRDTKLPLAQRIEKALAKEMPIDLLIYAAGFYQEGLISELSEDEIENMLDVSARGLLYITRYVLMMQNHLDNFILIGSTSQWTARALEPVYNFAKAGAALYAESLSESGSVYRTLLIGQSGMQTPFWNGTTKDIGDMLDPAWVASTILDELSGQYRFKYIKILRGGEQGPTRVEPVKLVPRAKESR